jgi:hypothetical protein
MKMSIIGRRKSRITALVVGLCVISTALWAGGSGFGDDDDAGEDEGPSYFGFVKDASGSTIPDTKVTVAVKDRGGVVTRTDALGAYKVPGFGKEISPDDVEITCEKPGYKQLRVLRRNLPPPDSKIPVETDCHMQRGA